MGRDGGPREQLIARLETGGRLRAAVFGAGVAACTLGAAPVATQLPLVPIGWTVLGVALLATLLTAVRPLERV